VLLVTGSVTVRPDAIDEAVGIALEHVHRSRTEPGCLLHSVHRDVEDPNRLVFLEHWQDRAALDQHFVVPESGRFVEQLAALAVEAPTMEIFDTAPLSALHQVARHHHDLDEAERFYAEVVGLPRIARFYPPGLVFFDLGGTRLLVEHGDPGTNSVLYFRTDDLDADWARLVAAGVEPVAEPHLVHPDTDGTFGEPGGEEWMAFFKDHEDGILALATRRDAV
jgi:quinol monooxygenase YgiN/predicted enzyme related to lactoylglutathione lyase